MHPMNYGAKSMSEYRMRVRRGARSSQVEAAG